MTKPVRHQGEHGLQYTESEWRKIEQRGAGLTTGSYRFPKIPNDIMHSYKQAHPDMNARDLRDKWNQSRATMYANNLGLQTHGDVGKRNVDAVMRSVNFKEALKNYYKGSDDAAYEDAYMDIYGDLDIDDEHIS